MTTRGRALTAKQIRDAGQRYREVRPSYEALGGRLATVLGELLDQAGVGLAQIEWRAKRVDSFVEKLTRKRTKYRDPLSDVTDLLGLRVITYTLTDVGRVGELLRAEFSVDEDRSVVKPETDDPDRFGYASMHYIVSLSSPRKDLAEWKTFAGYVVEVQVRTVLQHAWSAIDHRLNYKSTIEIPRELKRRLFRVSALLELADEQFDEVQRQGTAVTAEYTELVERGNLADLEVDASSLDVYLRTSGALDRWAGIACDVGVELDDDKTAAERDRRDLLKMLAATGVTTIGEFDDLLREAESWGRDALGLINRRSVEQGGEGVEITADDVLTLVLLVAKKAKPSVYQELLYLEPVPSALTELAQARR